MRNRRMVGWSRLSAIGVAMVLVGSALTGCGSGQSSSSGATGNAQVSLKLTFPQQAAWLEPAPTRASRLWATVEAWLPTATAAWARESVSNLSTLRVTVTGEGIQNPVTDEKQVSTPASGDVVTFDLEIPAGGNRVFTVDGFKNQLIIFTGRSAPITLTGGQPVSVEIALADNTGTINGSIPNGGGTGATATMTVQGTTFTAPITTAGTFTLDGVPRGAHSIQVSAPGFISKNVPVVVPAGDTVSVGTVVLDPIPPTAGIIAGTVVNANNQAAIPGATVTVDGLSLSATTTTSGSFTIPGVPVGAHTLTVNAQGFSATTTSAIQVTAGNSSSAGAIGLTPLPTTGSVTGTVVNATTQAAISGATIAINGLSTTSNGNGSFTIPGVPAGLHTLTVSASGFSTSATTSIQVTAGTSSSAGTIALTPIPPVDPITGTVVNATTQASISGATVAINKLSTTTTSNGSFSLTGVPAGSHTLTVSAPGFSSTTKSIQVTSGSNNSVGIITLTPINVNGSITGTVVDVTGAPIPSTTVAVNGLSLSTTTNGNGSFILTGVPAGQQILSFSAQGFIGASLSITVTAGSTVSIGNKTLARIPTTGSITGTVTNANTQAVLPGATVSVNGLSLSTTSASDGSFTLSGVPAGQHTLTVSATGFTSTTQTVTVVVGQPVSAGTIALVPIPTTGFINGTVSNITTDRRIRGATVAVNGLSTTTSSIGFFLLSPVPVGLQTVTISAPGFITKTETVSVPASVSFQLTPGIN